MPPVIVWDPFMSKYMVKTGIFAGMFIFAACACLAAYVKPTDEQVAKVAKNPAGMSDLLKEATAVQATEVLIKAIQEIKKQELSPEKQNAQIAVISAYVFKNWSADMLMIARMMAQSLPVELLTPVVATAAAVAGNQAPMVTSAFLETCQANDVQAIKNAGAHPETVIPEGIVISVGLPVAHSVPAVGREPTSLPVAPPLIVEGGRVEPVQPKPTPSPPDRAPEPIPVAVVTNPPPPPPIPSGYGGQ